MKKKKSPSPPAIDAPAAKPLPSAKAASSRAEGPTLDKPPRATAPISNGRHSSPAEQPMSKAPAVAIGNKVAKAAAPSSHAREASSAEQPMSNAPASAHSKKAAKAAAPSSSGREASPAEQPMSNAPATAHGRKATTVLDTAQPMSGMPSSAAAPRQPMASKKGLSKPDKQVFLLLPYLPAPRYLLKACPCVFLWLS